ncbi:MAG: UPF0158 family protein [Gammaproteobacteria bacterium]
MSLKYDDLYMAVDFVSSGASLDACAYICRETGKIWYESDDSFEEEVLPDDIGDTNKYAEVPDKRYLDLGKQLALDFVLQELPGHYEKVDSIFRRRGAYSRFKDLLCEHGALDAWYRFEESATRKALCAWAKEEGFEVQLEPDKTATNRSD